MLRTEENGRATSISSGYRPQFHVNGGDWACECHFKRGRLNPGDGDLCRLLFGQPDVLLPMLSVGDTFKLREGARIVAEGRIIKIRNERQTIGTVELITRTVKNSSKPATDD